MRAKRGMTGISQSHISRSHLQSHALFRSRRGQSDVLWWEVGQAVAAVMVVVAGIVYVNSLVEKGSFSKEFYAKDLGITLTALFASHSPLIYYYLLDIPSELTFDVTFRDNMIGVKPSTTSGTGYYWWLRPRATNASFSDESKIRQLKLVKTGGVGIGTTPELLMLTCPAIDTSQPGWESKHIIIDPLIIAEDSNSSESRETFKIAQQLAGTPSFVSTRTSSSSNPSLDDKKNAIPADTLALIGIRARAAGKDDAIIAYYPASIDEGVQKHSRALGCSIVNALLVAGIDASRAVILPSYAAAFITTDTPTVIIDITSKQVSTNQKGIATAISDGITGYLE